MRNLSKAIVLVLDEALLAALVLFILWKLGIDLSPAVLITVILLMGVWLFVLYRIIMSLGRRKKVAGQEGMIGLQGIVAKPLSPEGVIRIHGELWEAISTGGSIAADEEVVVVSVESLNLFVVRKDNTGKSC